MYKNPASSFSKAATDRHEEEKHPFNGRAGPNSTDTWYKVWQLHTRNTRIRAWRYRSKATERKKDNCRRTRTQSYRQRVGREGRKDRFGVKQKLLVLHALGGAVSVALTQTRIVWPATQQDTHPKQLGSSVTTGAPRPQRTVALTTCHFASLCRDEWDTNMISLQTIQMERQIDPLTWM